MPADIYLDHNALIYLQQLVQSDQAIKAKLFKNIADGVIQVVLSPWHWVEAARDKNSARARALAEFMDELKPKWLRDRRDLEKVEVQDAFLKFAKIDYERPAEKTSRSEIVGALNRIRLTEAQTPTSSEFVERLSQRPELMQPIIDSHQKNLQAIDNVRAALSAGRLSSDKKKLADRQLVESFVPHTTPAGIAIGYETRDAFLDTVTLKCFPTLATEAEIAEHTWKTEGQTRWNSMIDRIHLISALPHVDFIVSDDGYFSTLVPVAKATGFVKATLLTFADFRAKFL